jgi:ribosomal-protein-alanine N-acetyltransferase
MTRITGRKVYLVPFDERHLNDPGYLAWLSDIEVMRWIGRDEYLKPFEFAQVREYVESVWRNEHCSFFAVHDASDDAFVGTAKLNYFDAAGAAARSADVGIMLGDRTRWGKGLATDTLATLCAHAFDELGARKLTAGAIAGNDAVIRAFRRIGFAEEGRIRQKLLVAGEYRDHVLLGCFPPELVRVPSLI